MSEHESTTTLLEVRDLCKHFPIKRGNAKSASIGGTIRAVDGVDLSVSSGETLGIVGESGCGKSSLAQTLLRLEEPTSGQVAFKGADVVRMNRKELKAFRRKAQIVLQDPFESLNPRMSVGDIVTEPWTIHRGVVASADRRKEASKLLERVGLRPDYLNRAPGQFSGGQRQRISIARALALEPELLILDEPVSALDMSVQAQVLNLLQDLQQRLGLAYIFISHDLAVVRHVSDRIVVMYLGRVVETGDAAEVFDRPTHPYTQALLSAIPSAEVRHNSSHRIILRGDLPSASAPPSGCRFRTRCWKATEKCANEEPQLIDRLGTGHPSACHYPGLRSSDTAEPPAPGQTPRVSVSTSVVAPTSME
jgi:oligopeptide transport system ATP-binding protein